MRNYTVRDKILAPIVMETNNYSLFYLETMPILLLQQLEHSLAVIQTNLHLYLIFKYLA